MKLYQSLHKYITSKLYPCGRLYAIIGDEGAIITQIREGRLVKRNFFSEINEQTKAEIKAILNEAKSPLYLVVDNTDQEYKLQRFPAVNSLTIHSLVKKRLEREFTLPGIKGTYFLYRDALGKKEWVYLFANCPISGTFKEWYTTLLELTDRVEAVMLLPIESANLLQRLVEHFFIIPKQKAARFQMLVAQNKVSGFRQMVFEQGRLIFTRLVEEEDNQFKDVIAGNIQHEIYSTIEYLKRNGAEEAQELDIFMIVEQEVKKHLHHHHLKAGSVTILTPHDAAVVTKTPKATQASDRFADILTVATLEQGRPALYLSTAEIGKKVTLQRVSFWTKLATRLMAALIALSVMSQAVNYYRRSDAKQQLEELNASLVREIEQTRKASGIDFSQSGRIRELVGVYQYVTGDVISPVPLLAQFSRIMTEEMVVKDLNWQVERTETRSNVDGMRQARRSFTLVLNLEISNNASSYDDLFKRFEQFEDKVKNTFAQYDVAYPKIRQNINLSEVQKTIPIQITIKSGHGKA